MASSKNEFDLAISYDLKRVFVWLPTGFGKSICYWYTTLPFVFDHKLGRVDRDYVPQFSCSSFAYYFFDD